MIFVGQFVVESCFSSGGVVGAVVVFVVVVVVFGVVVVGFRKRFRTRLGSKINRFPVACVYVRLSLLSLGVKTFQGRCFNKLRCAV